MERIDTMERLSALVGVQMRRGVRTNNTMTPDDYHRELSAGTLYAHTLPEGLLLLHRRKTHWLLNYYFQPEAEPFTLPVQQPVVVEMPFRPKDAPMEGALLQLFQASGFYEQLRRVRLQRPAGPVVPPVTEFTVCKQAELLPALQLFTDCFDPITGCPPTAEDLQRDTVLCAMDDNGTFAGALQGEKREIRHLAVDPTFRHRHCAQALIAAWLTENEKTRVWTGADNDAALRTYAACGYQRDGWYSVVLCANAEK